MQTASTLFTIMRMMPHPNPDYNRSYRYFRAVTIFNFSDKYTN